MKYNKIVLVVILVAIYGFEIQLPIGHGVLMIDPEIRIEEPKESNDGYLPEYK